MSSIISIVQIALDIKVGVINKQALTWPASLSRISLIILLISLVVESNRLWLTLLSKDFLSAFYNGKQIN